MRNSFLILTIFSISLFAQKKPINEYDIIDKKVIQIPDSLSENTDDISKFIHNNFKSEKEKIRAIFIWVSSNIEYDIENMYALNFYEEKSEKISKTLKTKKGICENFAAIFNELCLKFNIKSFIIEGYTIQNGSADYIPHAWCAAKIDTSWFLFDPTWGSGYISNNKFYKKIDLNYFKIKPAKHIKTHIPFDYLWQFLNYPVTNQEFYEGKTDENKTKKYFNYLDSIKLFENQNKIQKLNSSAKRIEKNGIKNSMIFDRLQHIKIDIENNNVELYNDAILHYNEGVNKLNNFINYRNNQFKPKKDDSEIKLIIDESLNNFRFTKFKIDSIYNPNSNITKMTFELQKALNDANSQANSQNDWLKIYISKSKLGRKTMFYNSKITWFGIPLN